MDDLWGLIRNCLAEENIAPFDVAESDVDGISYANTEVKNHPVSNVLGWVQSWLNTFHKSYHLSRLYVFCRYLSTSVEIWIIFSGM